MKHKNTPKGPSYLSSIGETITDRLQYYCELMHDYGDIVKVPSIKRTYLVNSASMLHHILKVKPDNYVKGGLVIKPLNFCLGNGLLMTTGDKWKQRRKCFAPHFTRKSVESYFPAMQNCTSQAIETWSQHIANPGQSFDIAKASMKIVYRIALKTLFDENIDESKLNKILQAIAIENQLSASMLSFTPWLPSIANFRLRHARHYFGNQIKQLIVRAKQKSHSNHFIQTLLHFQDQNGNHLSEQDIFDECKTFLMTGHETSGTAVAWILKLLATYPQYQLQVKQEIKQVLGERLPKYDDLQSLPFTKAVLEESLRLYPPIWITGRVCQEDDQIEDYYIAKNSHILISPYTLHRRSLYWEDADTFMPERHLRPAFDKPPAMAFLPFGGGPRICIASHFAMTECMTIIIMIMQKFNISLDENYSTEPMTMISLKPRQGVWVYLDH